MGQAATEMECRMEKRYSISDAARQVSVEAHVLRYWEEELGLKIPRNSQGHRYYRENDIRTLHHIKELKEQGFQLRAIKLLMPDIGRVEKMSAQELYRLREELNQQVQIEEERKQEVHRGAQVMTLPTKGQPVVKMENTVTEISREQKLKQFETMMGNMIRGIVNEMQEESEQRICETVSTRLVKEMDYLVREREELQEKQVELLQQILVELKPVRQEVAASDEAEIKTLRSRRKGKKQEAKRKKARMVF